jgi:hypothetical protein
VKLTISEAARRAGVDRVTQNIVPTYVPATIPSSLTLPSQGGSNYASGESNAEIDHSYDASGWTIGRL